MKSHFRFIATVLIIASWVVTSLNPIGVTPARAASTITVNTTDSQVGDDGVCALHEAVINANNDAQTHVDCVAGSGADTIVFADSLGTATVTYLEGGGSVTDPDGLTIDGGGDITVSGANVYQVFVVSSGAALTVTNLTIANGSTAGNGGGIANDGGALTVTNSVFSGNRATTGSGWGGALYNSGTAVIADSSFVGNTATFYEGGAVYNAASGVLSISNSSFSGNGSPSVPAGAISNHGTATISASAFSGNVASTGSALYNVDGTLTVINSTLTGNSAILGGGIFSTQSGGTASLTVVNSTIANNTGGGVNVAGATTFKNTLVANNTGGNCSGTITNGGNNLDDGTSCGWGSVSGSMSSTNPQLGTLTGSPAAYYPLLAGSPAIDAGTNAGCPADDQRGVTRPQNGICDIGAFESQAQPGPAFTVNTSADTNDNSCDVLGQGIGNQDCTLREAINAANAISGADTITFTADYTITLASTLPNLVSTLTIDGSSHSVTVNGNNAVRVFVIQAGAVVTMSQLSIIDGRNDQGGGLLNQGTLAISHSTFSGNSVVHRFTDGGGIYNGGMLTVSHSTFSGNWGGDGGGISNSGTLTVSHSTFSGNSGGGGGGIYNNGTAKISNSTFSGNLASIGGGIYNDGTLTVTHSTLSGNSATGEGGGIFNLNTLHQRNSLIANSPSGGDCYNTGTLATNLNNLIRDGSCSPILSGDPLLSPLGDYGGSTQTHALLPGSPAIDAGDSATCLATDQRGLIRPQGVGCDIGAFEANVQAGPNFVVNVSGDLDDGACDAFVAGLTDCTLREAINAANNHAGADTITFAGDYTITLGSALPDLTTNLTIDGSGRSVTVSGDNTVRVFDIQAGAVVTMSQLSIINGTAGISEGGGGIINGGTLIVSHITFSGNSAYSGGGGIYNGFGTLTVSHSTFSGNSTSGIGGGLGNYRGTVTIANSTFSGNSAALDGGGIHTSWGMLTVSNSTFNGNSAERYGGGLLNDDTVTVSNSTFSGNSATNYGGGIENFGSLTVSHSTFSGNSSGAGGGIANDGTLHLRNSLIANSPSGGDCGDYGTITTNVNNLIEDGSCSPALSVDPLLSPLGSYGGSTQTFALLPGSPAIDTGDSATCLPTDQRDVARPQGSACDIGSFESRGFTLTKTDGDNQSTFVQTAFPNPLVISVTSAFGEPVNDGQVILTAPTSGASLMTTPITLTIANGAVSSTVTANGTVGSYSVIASASGAANVAFNLTNDPAGTTTSVTSTPNPSIVGQAVTFTATVISTVGTPSGSVQFYADGAALGSPLTLSNGHASLSAAALAVGTHAITATYSGDANHSGGISIQVEQVVNRATVYLPLISHNFVNAPDLIVQSLTANANTIQVVIQNQGTAPVVDEFWVDVYVNPITVPTSVNQTWAMLGDQGLVWGVTGNALPALTPGGVLTLTVGDAYFRSDLSHLTGTLSTGTPLYAQVDSANAGISYGAVLETHEVRGEPYNNLLGPVTSSPLALTIAPRPTSLFATTLPQRPH